MVDLFIELDSFKKTAGDILRKLRSSDKAPGQDRIYTAGEKEHIAFLERKEKGIPVPLGVQKDMVAMRDELGLAKYSFPWENS